MAHGLGQDVFTLIKFLVVSDLKALFKWCKEADILDRFGPFRIVFKWGLNLGRLTLRYMEIERCSFKSFEQCYKLTLRAFCSGELKRYICREICTFQVG